MSKIQAIFDAKDGITIEGSEEELYRLADALTLPYEITLPTSQDADLVECTGGTVLREIRIEHLVGVPACFSIKGSILVISGDYGKLATISSNIRFVIENTKTQPGIPPHTHEEYYEGTSFYSKDSVPTVIVLKSKGQGR